MASTSRVTNAMSGSKPAATHALRTMPRSEGATHGSSASSRRRTVRRRASRCSGPTAITNGSSSELVAAQPGVLARGSGRVLEQHGDVQAAVGHARGELLDGALDRLHPLGHHARDGRRHQRGQRAGEAAHAQRARGRRRARRAGRRPAPGARPGRRRARARPPRRRSASSPPGPRCSSRAPSSRSSAATCWDTAGWVSDSSRAAAENDPACATARKVSSRRGSSISSDYGMAEAIICADGHAQPP